MDPRSASIAALALALSATCPAAEVLDVSIRTARDGEFITVAASAVMKVDQGVAWAVLSDYDHLARFIPDMKSSRVVSRDGNRIRVQQEGDVGFFFYREPVNMLLEVHEEPPSRITARGIEGNIRGLETRYELRVLEAGIKLDYAGRFVPDFSIPPLIGMPLMNRLIERRFRAMVAEIQRRDALERGAAAQPVK
jgi:ribosome-associated toxin RatA of RatAB toxin-antitoxin module